MCDAPSAYVTCVYIEGCFNSRVVTVLRCAGADGCYPGAPVAKFLKEEQRRGDEKEERLHRYLGSALSPAGWGFLYAATASSIGISPVSPPDLSFLFNVVAALRLTLWQSSPSNFHTLFTSPASPSSLFLCCSFARSFIVLRFEETFKDSAAVAVEILL